MSIHVSWKGSYLRQMELRMVRKELMTLTTLCSFISDPTQGKPSKLHCLLVTQGSILPDVCSRHPLFLPFRLCLLAINDEAQQGGQAGFTMLASLLSRSCLQIFTSDREQTRTGTGGDVVKEELLRRLALKNISFLFKPPPLLPHKLTRTLCAALAHCPLHRDSDSDLPTTPMQLLSSLSFFAVPDIYHPRTAKDAEPPADAYFTQVATHCLHLHRKPENGSLSTATMKTLLLQRVTSASAATCKVLFTTSQATG